jgi:hypothetical protein
MRRGDLPDCDGEMFVLVLVRADALSCLSYQDIYTVRVARGEIENPGNEVLCFNVHDDRSLPGLYNVGWRQRDWYGRLVGINYQLDQRKIKSWQFTLVPRLPEITDWHGWNDYVNKPIQPILDELDREIREQLGC